jgi:DNA (cytosine-5)-methyltransferase 1
VSLGIQIKEKRVKLGLSIHDFADALSMGANGHKVFRSWEKGDAIPSDEHLKAIMEFGSVIPFEQNRKDTLFKFIDLFAGIGGIRIPFQELGGKCVFTSEWDKFAQKTYRINFGETPDGDITKINTDMIPEFDILLAGFPCQPFSQAGLKKGFEDTRGTLFFDIARIIADKRPKVFLLENVRQLKGHNKGKTLSVIIKHLRDLNYTVDYDILSATDFGVPQNRKRIYIVGFDKNTYNLDCDYSFPYPTPTGKPTRLGDILQPNVSERYTITDKIYEGHLRRRIEHKKKGNGFGYSLFSVESLYTNTISARYYKDGSEVLLAQGDGNNPRVLTPRECARLQGFPEEFIIPVSDTQAYRQFGNSVAIPVVRAIAENILSELLRFELLHEA